MDHGQKVELLAQTSVRGKVVALIVIVQQHHRPGAEEVVACHHGCEAAVSHPGQCLLQRTNAAYQNVRIARFNGVQCPERHRVVGGPDHIGIRIPGEKHACLLIAVGIAPVAEDQLAGVRVRSVIQEVFNTGSPLQRDRRAGISRDADHLRPVLAQLLIQKLHQPVPGALGVCRHRADPVRNQFPFIADRTALLRRQVVVDEQHLRRRARQRFEHLLCGLFFR
jgi:hypothetical protein